MNPEISILILTHNQRCLLERCLDSVLNQIIDVPHEIIVYDDRSNDGTMEFVKQLSCSEQVIQKKNLIELKYIYRSVDEKPEGVIGWNRLMAYKQARGKYFVNVDADDFLIGTDLYQKEYEMLEKHPECSMVQTRLLKLNEGEDKDKTSIGYPYSPKLEDGALFSLEDVLRYELIGQHQTYMYRRRPKDDMVRLLGNSFEDYYITYYHLQFGPVVFLDIVGYVWVQYPTSSSHSPNSEERLADHVSMLLNFARLFENSRYLFLSTSVGKLRQKIKQVPCYPNLSDNRRKRWSTSKVFMNRFYSEKHHSARSWAKYCIIRLLLFMIGYVKLNSKLWLDLLYQMMV